MEGRAGLTRQENEIGSVLGEALGADQAGGAKPIDPASRVDDHFKWVHDFVAGKEGGTPPMEAAIANIAAMYQDLNQTAGAANPGTALLTKVSSGGGGAAGAAAKLATLSQGLPKPIAAMLDTVSKSGTAVVSSGASASLQDSWKSNVLPLCQEAFNRYPFIASASADVPLDDFTRLLGPAGLMDKFFADNLKPLVDTSHSPWRWQSADHASLGLSQTTLVEFENAAKIRDALYASGSMGVKFQLTPVALDPGIGKITVTIAGKSLTYDHGPTQSAAFSWPAGDGSTLVRVTMTRAHGGAETVVDKDGPWSLLRLMDSARLIPSGQPDQFKLVFTAPGGSATFQLNANSVRNPFTLSAFRSFRCPASL